VVAAWDHLHRAGEQWAALPGGRVFFAGSEWSDVGAGYMNGAIHNGRKHGSLVAGLLERELRGKVEL
jgi:monoamine oxidase